MSNLNVLKVFRGEHSSQLVVSGSRLPAPPLRVIYPLLVALSSPPGQHCMGARRGSPAAFFLRWIGALAPLLRFASSRRLVLFSSASALGIGLCFGLCSPSLAVFLPCGSGRAGLVAWCAVSSIHLWCASVLGRFELVFALPQHSRAVARLAHSRAVGADTGGSFMGSRGRPPCSRLPYTVFCCLCALRSSVPSRSRGRLLPPGYGLVSVFSALACSKSRSCLPLVLAVVRFQWIAEPGMPLPRAAVCFLQATCVVAL